MTAPSPSGTAAVRATAVTAVACRGTPTLTSSSPSSDSQSTSLTSGGSPTSATGWASLVVLSLHSDILTALILQNSGLKCWPPGPRKLQDVLICQRLSLTLSKVSNMSMSLCIKTCISLYHYTARWRHLPDPVLPDAVFRRASPLLHGGRPRTVQQRGTHQPLD